jgi:dihydrofolate reductase
MRKLIVSNSVTLDGKVDEVRDWALPGDDDEFVKHQTELLSHSDGLVLGRGTYEFFAAVWPSRSGEFPDRMNGIAKHVASTTLEELEWENSHLLEGDVPEAVAELKRQPGQDLVVYGSHDLIQSLSEHDLIDEYQLWVYPVVLGRGRSFFEDGGERMALDLVDSTVIPPGVAILGYRVQRRTR